MDFLLISREVGKFKNEVVQQEKNPAWEEENKEKGVGGLGEFIEKMLP